MPDVPYHDFRDSGSERFHEQHADALKALLHDTCHTYGLSSAIPARALLPIGDRLAKRWLERTGNPYRHEIDAVAAAYGGPGVHAFNLSYEWGCTGAVLAGEAGPSLLRVLDWPFNGLGRHLHAVHLQGAAGDYLDLTWPGLSGSFQLMAPGRFSAAINQAPMRRYGLSLPVDWLINRRRMFRENGLPPAHLLRQVAAEAQDYDEARRRLTETPICLPVIYLLAGTKPGEGCIIERLERDAVVHELADQPLVTVSNHWRSRFNQTAKGWLSRAIESPRRCELMTHRAPFAAKGDFSLLPYPIISHLTRLCTVLQAANGEAVVQAYEAEGPCTGATLLKASMPARQADNG